jgi:Tfp pilus assembly protein PilX
MKDKRERGATLLVSLIMLVILTLFVIAAINMSSVNLKIVGNVQTQKKLEADIQQAIEQVLSQGANFSLTPVQQTVTVNGTAVTIFAPTCKKAVVASGYSAVTGPVPEDSNWEVVATHTDAATGAKATLRQGIKIRLPPGNCPS